MCGPSGHPQLLVGYGKASLPLNPVGRLLGWDQEALRPACRLCPQ